MIEHADSAAPREACGLVAYGGDGRPARLYRLSNVHSDPARFEIDPVGHFRTIVEVESKGWTIGAVYHSHPRGPSRPSRLDLEAGIDRDWISFIVGRRWRGWRVLPFVMVENSSVLLR